MSALLTLVKISVKQKIIKKRPGHIFVRPGLGFVIPLAK